MKIYKVKVNGRVYQVELESVETKDGSIQADPTPKKSSPSHTGKTIPSPMQGTIQDILVKAGETVKKGDSLLILEAMKLENDITADKDYKILEILVKVGDSVDSDQALIKVE
ncbi:MAG TPA: biotin/lipoyl-containing protein [Candidatus Izemoplasmatales bacterium]|nr:biotin/lipoyl-containing protein [Candidatus Izemoplasmatales bacterium]